MEDQKVNIEDQEVSKDVPQQQGPQRYRYCLVGKGGRLSERTGPFESQADAEKWYDRWGAFWFSMGRVLKLVRIKPSPTQPRPRRQRRAKDVILDEKQKLARMKENLKSKKK